MRTIVIDIDIERPNDGEHYTVYYRQGELAGNMLLSQETVEAGNGYMEAAQAYLDTHAEEVPKLADLPNLAEAGAVTKYLVEESQDSSSGMVFIENDIEEITSLIEELKGRDSRIQTCEDVLKSLEEDFKKFPVIRDYIEYGSPDEYIPSGEPLIHSYTGLASAFASTVTMVRDRDIDKYTKHFSIVPAQTSNKATPYDDVVLIRPGFHDETEPTIDAYPVIADNNDLLYIEENFKDGQAAKENARYRLVLKDGEMVCKALGEIADKCPVQGALCSSNNFDTVHAKAKELLPRMKAAKERLDAMYETAMGIHIDTSSLTNQFMQVYWNAYNSPNMTDKDDHDAACCKAIAHCLDNGTTNSEILKLVDTKAPMAVWEKVGQYAIRIVGEVNREREVAKTSSKYRSR